jgi:hypothetical protein
MLIILNRRKKCQKSPVPERSFTLPFGNHKGLSDRGNPFGQISTFKKSAFASMKLKLRRDKEEKMTLAEIKREMEIRKTIAAFRRELDREATEKAAKEAAKRKAIDAKLVSRHSFHGRVQRRKYSSLPAVTGSRVA